MSIISLCFALFFICTLTTITSDLDAICWEYLWKICFGTALWWQDINELCQNSIDKNDRVWLYGMAWMSSIVGRNVWLGSDKRFAIHPLQLRLGPGVRLRPARILYMWSSDPWWSERTSQTPFLVSTLSPQNSKETLLATHWDNGRVWSLLTLSIVVRVSM